MTKTRPALETTAPAGGSEVVELVPDALPAGGSEVVELVPDALPAAQSWIVEPLKKTQLALDSDNGHQILVGAHVIGRLSDDDDDRLTRTIDAAIQAAHDEMRAAHEAAASDPRAVSAREAASRLSAALTATRADLAAAQALAGEHHVGVRVALANGDDPSASEARRDDAVSKAARLETRVKELTVLHAASEQAAEQAAADAVADAMRACREQFARRHEAACAPLVAQVLAALPEVRAAAAALDFLRRWPA
jgi:hypothetical protein